MRPPSSIRMAALGRELARESAARAGAAGDPQHQSRTRMRRGCPSLTRLHANEAPWRPAGDATAAGLNRYPEPQPARADRTAGRAVRACPRAALLATHGSDEAIDLLSRIYLRAGADAILQCTPTFGMYQVAARIQGAGVIEVPLERAHGLSLDPERLLAAWRPQREARVPVLAQQPDRQSARRRRDRGGMPRARRQGHRRDRRGVHRVGAPAQPHRLARALLDARHTAHPVEGACPGRRARRRAARRTRSSSNWRGASCRPTRSRSPPSKRRCAPLEPQEASASRRRIDALLAEREYLRERLLRLARWSRRCGRAMRIFC